MGAGREGSRAGPVWRCRRPDRAGQAGDRADRMTVYSFFWLGCARSGKSKYAQARAEAIAGRHILVATGEARDAEMRDRIARHRADRDQRWRTVEAPRDLAAAIDAAKDRKSTRLNSSH